MLHKIGITTLDGIFPVRQDKKGLMWLQSDVFKSVVTHIQTHHYFKRRAKIMTKDLEEATNLINESTSFLEVSIEKLLKTENDLMDKSKKVSGSVRKSAHDLMTGMAAIEKMANFDKLERYVMLLERTASAMTILSELDKNGKLEKLMTVIKN
tara:strand:- start:527 stop:985 length:459 start_codon:yes stop_codon:yes gene_type:complete